MPNSRLRTARDWPRAGRSRKPERVGDDYVQLVGGSCAVCGERVATAREARACATCKAVVHRKCTGHTCAPETVAAAQAPAQAKKERWGGWPFVGATIGVMVASGISPVVSHWREQSFIRAHVAADLRCSEDDVRIDVHDDEIHATGCGDRVSYLVGCRPITKDQCLVMMDIPNHQIDELIDSQLHLHH